MGIIQDRFSAYTKPQTCVLIFISGSNHNATIAKLINHMGQGIQEWTK